MRVKAVEDRCFVGEVVPLTTSPLFCAFRIARRTSLRYAVDLLPFKGAEVQETALRGTVEKVLTGKETPEGRLVIRT